jgi:ADP-ribose pyrophosphatase YjhB (NUDIX family)
MKKIILSLAALSMLAACHESLEDRCAREVKEYTEKKCPAMIAETVRIDSLGFDKDTHTVHYYYTLLGKADNAQVVAKSNPRKALIQEVKNATSMETFKEAGYNFSYTYWSENHKGLKLFETTINKKDYAK